MANTSGRNGTSDSGDGREDLYYAWLNHAPPLHHEFVQRDSSALDREGEMSVLIDALRHVVSGDADLTGNRPVAPEVPDTHRGRLAGGGSIGSRGNPLL